MQFQILNSNNQPLTLAELNKSAADFWGVEISDDYAAPKETGISWYHTIGRTIAHCIPTGKCDWSVVIGDLCTQIAAGDFSYDEFINLIEFNKPYIELCLYWKKQGYTPVSC